MLFYIFLTLLIVSIVFMALGFLINIPLISFIGALLMFGLSFTMLNVDVEIRTGELTNINYNGSIPSNLESSYTYVPYDFGTLGQSSYAMIMLLLSTALVLIFVFKLGD